MKGQSSFFTDKTSKKWGSPEEVERRRRILVSAAAYAYEILNRPFWSDAKYDKEARRINLKQPTGNRALDKWFKNNFKPHTGMWIHNHPDIDGLRYVVSILLPERRIRVRNKPDRRIRRGPK